MTSKQSAFYIALHIWDMLDSDSEDEDVRVGHPPLLQKIYNFVEEIVPRMLNNQFKMHFRMSRNTFDDFVAKMYAVNEELSLKRGQVELPLEKRCLITVWCLANPECFRSVADRFGIAISTCWRTLYVTCKDILKVNKKYNVVKWPSDQQSEAISNYFFEKNSFPGVIGCIDGTHIGIKAPKFSPGSYINRKGYHSLLLQAVCNHELLFTDCYAGEAGSIHDALLYKRSDLCRSIEVGTIQIPNNYHIIGDAAYPLKNELLTPFKENGYLTNRQKNYNKIVSKVRQCIERAFALLKGRFRRLKMLDTVRQDLATLIIISACIMHNICILQGDISEEMNDPVDSDPPQYLNINDVGLPLREAVRKRDNIVNSLPLA